MRKFIFLTMFDRTWFKVGFLDLENERYNDIVKPGHLVKPHEDEIAHWKDENFTMSKEEVRKILLN